MRSRTYSVHREMAKSRGPGGLMKMYGYTEEEADLIWDLDFGSGYERWMEDYGKGMEDVVKVYNSTRRKIHEVAPDPAGLHYAYIGGGKVHFTDK